MILMSRILLFLILFIPASWTATTRKNAAIKAASRDYAEANYEASVASHLRLSTDFGINSPNSSYNLALSYHYNNQLEEAQAAYLGLIGSANPIIASFASNQNGTILGKQEKYKDALEAFKFALIKDPLNEPARYNYELLSRWLEENED
jgi:tetratricopeptide (TPR) repeat protein